MNGCWTCRLRRKKCDEERPCCQNCTRLQLDCSYGQKPAWMDRGVLEREEALAIKNKIAQNTRRRGKSLSSAATSHIMDQDEPPIENLATSISVNQDPVLTEPPLPLFSDGWYESCDLGGSVSHTPGESVPNLDLLLEDCDGDFGLWYSDHSSKSDAVVSPSLSLQAELLQGSDSTENSSKRRRGNTVPSTDFFGSNRSQNMSVWAFPRGDGSTSSSSHPSSIASTLEYGKNASKSKSEGTFLQGSDTHCPKLSLMVCFSYRSPYTGRCASGIILHRESDADPVRSYRQGKQCMDVFSASHISASSSVDFDCCKMVQTMLPFWRSETG